MQVLIDADEEEEMSLKKKRKNPGRILAVVLAAAMIAGISPAASFAAKPSIVSKTTTEGDITTTVITKTEEEGNYTDKSTTTYIKNAVTGEQIKATTDGTYVNKPERVTVKTLTTRTGEGSEARTEGSITAAYDATQYLSSKDVEVSVETGSINKAIDSLQSILSDIPAPKDIDTCIAVEAKLAGSDNMTVSIPREGLKAIQKISGAKLRIDTQYVGLELDSKALGEILSGGSAPNVKFTLKMAESDQKAYADVLVYNGQMPGALKEGTAKLFLGFSSKFGMEQDMIKLYVTEKETVERTELGDFAYDTASSTLTADIDCFGTFKAEFGQTAFSDTGSHWARGAIDRWSGLGVVKGYGGKFNPDNPVTRGDMAVILGKVMGYSDKGAAEFSDLDKGQYYADAVLAANAAGVLSGSGGKARAEEPVTREEATVMLGSALGVAPQSRCEQSFADEAKVSGWAKEYVNAFVNKGLMNGSGGNINPDTNITRAELASLLDKSIAELVNNGTYTENVKGKLLVNGKNVTLKGMTVTGDLILADGIGDGSAVLKDVTVTGRTIVRGGGTDSIQLDGNTKLRTVELRRPTGPVRLAKDSSAEVGEVAVVEGGGQAVLSGAYPVVNVTGSVPLKLETAKVTSLSAISGDTKVTVDSLSHVNKAVIHGDGVGFDVAGELLALEIRGQKAEIEGTGKLDEVMVYGSDAQIKTNGTEVTVAENVSGTTGGSGKGLIAIGAGKTATTPGTKPGVSSSGKVEVSVSPNAPRIETTLKDGTTFRGSKVTFDVWATTSEGKKIDRNDVTVQIGEDYVDPAWDDSVKTSYTITLSQGTNTIVITAADGDDITKKTITVYGKLSGDGESIGNAVFTLERLTLDGQFIIEPQKVEIFEGENAAYALERFLSQNGYDHAHSGSMDGGFYLQKVEGDGVAPATLKIQDCLQRVLDDKGAVLEPKADLSTLGEFDYTSMSGWMYSVNNVFPNVGFSEKYLQDGDVVRVQFTLWGHGRDIGDSGSTGSSGGGFYEIADKTKLIKKAANGMSSSVRKLLTQLDASQSDIDKAL